MNLLLCCEYYAPSVGGVQEVTRQIAERLVQRGHNVTVATTALSERHFEELNGVQIRGFAASGNRVRGLAGDIDAYREFVIQGDFDVVLIKAAQQWTFDALWEVLDRIDAGKVFIPCGFSALYEPSYAEYFRLLPPVLAKFDRLIFYAECYRDVDFARQHGLRNFSIVPNGASECEFEVAQDRDFRGRQNIPEDAFLLLSVGAPPVNKGFLEIIGALSYIDIPDRPIVALLNTRGETSGWREAGKYLAGNLRGFGARGLVKSIAVLSLSALHLWRIVDLLGLEWDRPYFNPVRQLAKRTNRVLDGVHVRLVDLKRAELIQAYLSADLFVFASRVEYSPLVLFESAAAGLPFLSVPVGNAAEIARWTGGGVICPADADETGDVQVDPGRLADEISRVSADKELLDRLGRAGRKSWRARFTWAAIVNEYERILVDAARSKDTTNRHSDVSKSPVVFDAPAGA